MNTAYWGIGVLGDAGPIYRLLHEAAHSTITCTLSMKRSGSTGVCALSQFGQIPLPTDSFTVKVWEDFHFGTDIAASGMPRCPCVHSCSRGVTGASWSEDHWAS